MSIELVPETPVVIDTEIASITEISPATEETPDVDPENPDVSPENPSENPDALIRVLKSGSCPSLTSRSTLGYQLGLKDESELYLRLISNTGSGFFSKQWVACSVIEQLINGSAELTSTSFKALFPNKSVNTGGFVMAVIKALGLIQTNPQNSRWHQQVPEMTFDQVAIEAMVQEDEAQPVPIRKRISPLRGITMSIEFAPIDPLSAIYWVSPVSSQKSRCRKWLFNLIRPLNISRLYLLSECFELYL